MRKGETVRKNDQKEYNYALAETRQKLLYTHGKPPKPLVNLATNQNRIVFNEGWMQEQAQQRAKLGPKELPPDRQLRRFAKLHGLTADSKQPLQWLRRKPNLNPLKTAYETAKKNANNTVRLAYRKRR